MMSRTLVVMAVAATSIAAADANAPLALGRELAGGVVSAVDGGRLVLAFEGELDVARVAEVVEVLDRFNAPAAFFFTGADSRRCGRDSCGVVTSWACSFRGRDARMRDRMHGRSRIALVRSD
jgi:peptidoglycan/xylan/chitin deacetylase (PgdA/CDA1 family)